MRRSRRTYWSVMEGFSLMIAKNGYANRGLVFSLVVALCVLPNAVRAQAGDSGFSLGLSSGFVRASDAGLPLIIGGVPQFEPGGFGYYMQTTLTMPSPLRMIRPRADLLFADWGQHLTALTGNLVFTPISSKKVAPYLLAGAGAYGMQGAGVKAGWTLGAGLRLPGEKWSVTIESRVHAFIRANAWPEGSKRSRSVFMPIGLGIHF
ncbi:MAG: hypothetical protein ACJ8AK_13845 [Gemmatimonadaceae bacterium]